MTETQAHQFIKQWEKTTFPQRWRAKTETLAVQRLEQTFIGLIIGVIAVMLSSFDSLTTEICSLLVLSFLFWLYLRLRKARHVLGCSQIVNRKS